jgi:hypothetical protein
MQGEQGFFTTTTHIHLTCGQYAIVLVHAMAAGLSYALHERLLLVIIKIINKH